MSGYKKGAGGGHNFMWPSNEKIRLKGVNKGENKVQGGGGS